MPDIFDRLGSLLRSIFSEGEIGSSYSPRYYDEDMQEAWDELEEYLNAGRADGFAQKRRREQPRPDDVPHTEPGREKLRPDYANLKVPFGAPFAEVKQAYKKLLRQYHPDKHASDPQKYKLATEITSKLNQSFQRIEEYERNATR